VQEFAALSDSKIAPVSELCWLDQGDRLRLAAAKTLVEVEGEALELFRAVLHRLSGPKRAEEIAHESGIDLESVEACIEWLTERGFARPYSPPEPHLAALREAMRRGVLVSGPEPLSTPIAGAIEDLIEVRPKCLEPRGCEAEELEGRLLISVSSSLADPAVTHEAALARAGGALHLPVWFQSRKAYIGPLARSGGPCARCAVLRLLARGAWTSAEIATASLRGGSVSAPLPANDESRAVAGHVARFLLAIDAEGRLEGARDPLLAIDLDSGTAGPHRIFSHVLCRVCGKTPPAVGAPAKEELGASRHRIISHWRGCLESDSDGLGPDAALVEEYQDPVTGLIDYGEEWSRRARYFRNYPVCWGGTAFVRELDKTLELVSTGRQGINGTGPSLDHMRKVCVSEGLERYVQYAHRPDVRGVPYEKIKEHAFDPRNLTLYEPHRYDEPGFPRPRFTEDLPLDWTWGYGLTSGEARLFPEELIGIWLYDETYPNRIVDQNLTSGGASHVSYKRALLNGLRELIERDALMIAWYENRRLPQIRLPERIGDAYADDLLRFLAESGTETTILDLRVDFPIPTFFLLGRRKKTLGCWEAGGTALVATADLDPVAALCRGLRELAIHYETLCLTPDPSKDWRSHPYDPNNPEQGWRRWMPTYMYYLNPANQGPLGTLYSPSGDTSFLDLPSYATGSPGKDLETLLALFEERKLEPWAWDMALPEVEESGFRIVKTLVPGLIDLTPGYQSRRLATPRLPKVSNHDPHPNA
jgi:ribosomal protein S12 methylthiotransferase accessory factor